MICVPIMWLKLQIETLLFSKYEKTFHPSFSKNLDIDEMLINQ